MKIGIDIDDTICRTTEKVNELMEVFSKEENIEPLMIMNYEDIKEKFFDKYLEEIYSTVVVKRNAKDVLRRLKSKGNKLYVITARSSEFFSKKVDVLKITSDWLKKNDIEVDGIFTDAYGEEKARICRENDIDIIIDDDPYNYKMITSNGCKCLLFDDREKYNLDDNYVTSWLEVEKFIEQMRWEK